MQANRAYQMRQRALDDDAAPKSDTPAHDNTKRRLTDYEDVSSSLSRPSSPSSADSDQEDDDENDKDEDFDPKGRRATKRRTSIEHTSDSSDARDVENNLLDRPKRGRRPGRPRGSRARGRGRPSKASTLDSPVADSAPSTRSSRGTRGSRGRGRPRGSRGTASTRGGSKRGSGTTTMSTRKRKRADSDMDTDTSDSDSAADADVSMNPNNDDTSPPPQAAANGAEQQQQQQDSASAADRERAQVEHSLLPMNQEPQVSAAPVRVNGDPTQPPIFSGFAGSFSAHAPPLLAQTPIPRSTSTAPPRSTPLNRIQTFPVLDDLVANLDGLVLLARVQATRANFASRDGHRIAKAAYAEPSRPAGLHVQVGRQRLSCSTSDFALTALRPCSRFNAFCSSEHVDIPVYPITIAKVAIFLARATDTAAGKFLRARYPQPGEFPLPVARTVLDSPQVPLNPGEGSKVSDSLMRCWIDALAYAQSCTHHLWTDICTPDELKTVSDAPILTEIAYSLEVPVCPVPTVEVPGLRRIAASSSEPRAKAARTNSGGKASWSKGGRQVNAPTQKQLPSPATSVAVVKSPVSSTPVARNGPTISSPQTRPDIVVNSPEHGLNALGSGAEATAAFDKPAQAATTAAQKKIVIAQPTVNVEVSNDDDMQVDPVLQRQPVIENESAQSAASASSLAKAAQPTDDGNSEAIVSATVLKASRSRVREHKRVDTSGVMSALQAADHLSFAFGTGGYLGGSSHERRHSLGGAEIIRPIPRHPVSNYLPAVSSVETLLIQKPRGQKSMPDLFSRSQRGPHYIQPNFDIEVEAMKSAKQKERELLELLAAGSRTVPASAAVASAAPFNVGSVVVAQVGSSSTIGVDHSSSNVHTSRSLTSNAFATGSSCQPVAEPVKELPPPQPTPVRYHQPPHADIQHIATLGGAAGVVSQTSPAPADSQWAPLGAASTSSAPVVEPARSPVQQKSIEQELHDLANGIGWTPHMPSASVSAQTSSAAGPSAAITGPALAQALTMPNQPHRQALLQTLLLDGSSTPLDSPPVWYDQPSTSTTMFDQPTPAASTPRTLVPQAIGHSNDSAVYRYPPVAGLSGSGSQAPLAVSTPQLTSGSFTSFATAAPSIVPAQVITTSTPVRQAIASSSMPTTTMPSPANPQVNPAVVYSQPCTPATVVPTPPVQSRSPAAISIDALRELIGLGVDLRLLFGQTTGQ
ncbi:hypothetical protein ACM66B_004270 [Microbotryomycetes sp. NB124-2]